jgi:Ni,Fe-hydrogenase I large subunit
VYGVAPEQWLAATGHDGIAAWAASGLTQPARLLGELLARAPELGRSDVALMPSLEPAALLAAVVPAMRSDPGFERAPTWAGATAETGALARTRSHPIVAAFVAERGNAVPTRMVARLTELALLLGRLPARPALLAVPRWTESIRLAEGEGIAAVQTARGLLLHRATVTEVHVTGYQIVAPTEWNFHPQGALVRGLEGAATTDAMALERDARLVVQALDPCVSCRVEVAGA